MQTIFVTDIAWSLALVTEYSYTTDNTQVIEFNGVPKKHILVTTGDGKMVTTVALNDNGFGTANLEPGQYTVHVGPI